jgi:3-phosphoshikimate 1-carboxyvinyltransferase
VEHLQKLGVSVAVTGDEMHIKGGTPLKAVDFDGSLAPDAVLPLAAVSAYAEGTSRFMNIEHIRYKECDRISDFRAQLEKAGVRTEEKRDELIVHGSPDGIKGAAEIDGHYDHGVIMAMTAVALGSQHGLTIRDPRHVAQTYPHFYDDLASIGGIVEPIV